MPLYSVHLWGNYSCVQRWSNVHVKRRREILRDRGGVASRELNMSTLRDKVRCGLLLDGEGLLQAESFKMRMVDVSRPLL